ncbi:MAG TPA: GNAT family N-acetyltransferase [Gemmatimonadaceae bacterium]|nr:GNAT family N-acetyltransferase [Gemmatimonadaceae bacterium]
MTQTSSVARPIEREDLQAARALLKADAAVQKYLKRAREIIEDAATGSKEHLALVTGNARELRGVVLFGPVAGADGAASLAGVSVLEPRRRRGVASALVSAACARMQERGARLIVAELADDPVLAAAHGLLAKCGFAQSGRVPDFYKKGVDLVVLERRLVG